MFDDLNVYVLDYNFKVLCKGNKKCSNGTNTKYRFSRRCSP